MCVVTWTASDLKPNISHPALPLSQYWISTWYRPKSQNLRFLNNYKRSRLHFYGLFSQKKMQRTYSQQVVDNSRLL